MDSYLYAPKDDYKHRAYWRELYMVEEAEHLTGICISFYFLCKWLLKCLLCYMMYLFVETEDYEVEGPLKPLHVL